MRYSFDALKPYTLEVYAADAPETLLWKRDSQQPFTPMARGDRLLLPEAREARADRPMSIVEVEHVIWTRGDEVRFATRVTVVFEGAPPP